jgi:hypothetical protein
MQPGGEIIHKPPGTTSCPWFWTGPIYSEDSAVDIPRIFNVSESADRIHNPLSPEKLATLGAALRLEPGTRVLDLGSGSARCYAPGHANTASAAPAST